MRGLTEEDRDLVTAAVTAAERGSDGEIVTIIAARSDAYHDVALHYAVLAMLLVPAALAFVPQAWIDWAATLVLGWNAGADPRDRDALPVRQARRRLPDRPADPRLPAAPAWR